MSTLITTSTTSSNYNNTLDKCSPEQQQQQSNKELSLFNSFNDDYLKSLVYFELDEQDQSYLLDENQESLLKDQLQSNEKLSSKIQNIYVLYGNRSLLVVCKDPILASDQHQSIVNIIKDLFRTLFNLNMSNHQIPFNQAEFSSSSSFSFQLVTELNDAQFNLISDDKSKSLKYIESKTGLKLKKIKKSFFFTGFLFQFVLLNKLLKEFENKKQSLSSNNASSSSSSRDQVQPPTSDNDWKLFYTRSQTNYHFKIGKFNIYIFEADLTDLNTDCLVNPTNPNLHPGYVGEGVSRRIREKAGKQLQDACKKILSSYDNHLLNDSNVCYTKSSGKLKCKYLIHAVCPTWTKYFTEQSNNVRINSQLSDNFESLVEKTFMNIFKQAHDLSLNLNSIAFPVSSNGPSGGAFDLPIDLFAHIFYTQLSNFHLDSKDLNSHLDTICICSSEANTVKQLIEAFSMYSEMCSTTLWAMPDSPMYKLLKQQFPNFDSINNCLPSPSTNPNVTTNLNQSSSSSIINTNYPISSSNSNTIIKTRTYSNSSINSMNSVNSSNRDRDHRRVYDRKFIERDVDPENEKTENDKDFRQHDERNIQNRNYYNNSNNQNTHHNTNSYSHHLYNNHNNHNNYQREHKEDLRINKNPNGRFIKSNNNNNNNSNNYSNYTANSEYHNNNNSNNSNNNNNNSQIDSNRSSICISDSCCLFCQKENSQNLNTSSSLVSCGNSQCKSAFCEACLYNYINGQNTNKCPSCRSNIDKSLIQTINNNYNSASSSSSSSSISPTRLNQPQSTTATINPLRNRINYTTNNSNSQNHNIQNSHQIMTNKYPITEAKIYIRKLDEPCSGYENFKSLLITFEINDGIQNDKHPKPGQPYKGTTKRAYLPDIKEHIEVLSFYEKALKTGLLFKLEWNRYFGDYRVHLNQEVLLKTSQNGGGRFGYPDSTYIDDLLKMAKNFKF